MYLYGEYYTELKPYIKKIMVYLLSSKENYFIDELVKL